MTKVSDNLKRLAKFVVVVASLQACLCMTNVCNNASCFGTAEGY